MTPTIFAHLVVAAFAPVNLEHTIAVVAGDAEIEIAHERFAAGTIDGYVAVADSPAGLVISSAASCPELDTLLEMTLDRLTSRLGGRQLTRGVA